MRKTKLLLALLLISPTMIFAQMDCSSFLKDLKVDNPFNLSSLSKSAVCVSGHSYEFVVPLSKGVQYRFVFYASSVFNNNIHFKMTDLNTNKEIINLPGASETNEKGTAALAPYQDPVTYNNIHPYFDVFSSNATSIKVVIDVAETKSATDLIKGCISVVILDRTIEGGSFE